MVFSVSPFVAHKETDYELRLARLSRPATGRGRRSSPRASRPVRDPRLPGALGRPDAGYASRPVDVLDRERRHAADLDVGGVPRPPERAGHGRHPLRHPLVEARHDLEGRVGRHAPGRGRPRRGLRARILRRRLHHQPAARGRDRREGLGRLHLRGRASRPRARWPGAAPRPAPLLLEKC